MKQFQDGQYFKEQEIKQPYKDTENIFYFKEN